MTRNKPHRVHNVELLAPAGDREAGLAAFHYGARAVYLGLQKYSARAEATNFTPDQLSEITAYAHQLTPRRSVFVTVNTLVLDSELPGVVETLDYLNQIGVDAVIVQDMGVVRIARRYFPSLVLHASTQLAVHSLDGVRTLREMGFRRVTLARELTLDEIREIAAQAGIETEVFIHGALCYSYSGLCLFSSLLRGRSGNRGRCAYPCRDGFCQPDEADEVGFAFSMKDLALPEHVEALRDAGVTSFKIEGRKKNALYVAATVDYYRRLLDGRLPPKEQGAAEADLQTIFSRPWTPLYLASRRNQTVVDRDTVGHRGTPVGAVEAVTAVRHGPARLRFRTRRPLELHDGLQVDLPVAGKPFGFPVDSLWVAGGRSVVRAPAGAVVEVALPPDRPELPRGAPIYCSSSQAVKRRFPYDRPKPDAFRVRFPVELTVSLSGDRLATEARIPLPLVERADAGAGQSPKLLQSNREWPGPFAAATNPGHMPATARSAFEKLGDTPFRLAAFEFQNPQGCFVPVSALNQMRRELGADLAAAWRQETAERIAGIIGELGGAEARGMGAKGPRPASGFDAAHWILRVDRPRCLSTFETADWEAVEELTVAMDVEPLADLVGQLDALAAAVGHDRIRLAMPMITRRHEASELAHRIERLSQAGWRKWEASNVSAWAALDGDGRHVLAMVSGEPTAADLSSGEDTGLDLAADWPLYTLNRLAAEQWRAMGLRRVTLSPEDGFANLRPLLERLGDRAAVIVYQDTPLFLSESCPAANLAGGCPGWQHCHFTAMDLTSNTGEEVLVINRRCRAFTINQQPFCLSDRLEALRAAGARRFRVDFAFRRYAPDEVRVLWRKLRAGQAIPGTHAGNFDRGLE